MADEGGILAEGLLGAPPAGIAGDIEHRRQPLMRADAAQLLADFGGHLGGQFGLEGAGKPQHLRVHRAAQPHVAGAAFLVNHGRDAEPGLLDKVALQGVVEARDRGGFEGGIPGGAGDLPDAMLEQAIGLAGREILVLLNFVHPDGADLGQFLVQRHLGEQGMRRVEMV